ncbi:unnamed protein product [Prunus brigantina]
MATDTSATMATDAFATIPVPEINSSTPTLITINVIAQLPVKLTPTNYPSWRAQFNALLYGYDLMGYVDGSSLPINHSTRASHLLDSARSTLSPCDSCFRLTAGHLPYRLCQDVQEGFDRCIITYLFVPF